MLFRPSEREVRDELIRGGLGPDEAAHILDRLYTYSWATLYGVHLDDLRRAALARLPAPPLPPVER